MKLTHRIVSLLTSALVVAGMLPMPVQAENPAYDAGRYVSITLAAGNAKDFWTDTMSFLIASGDPDKIILKDDAATDGTDGAIYQKLAARSALFDGAFTPAESDDDCDITVQKGDIFYLAVNHDIRASGHPYLSEVHTILTYAAGAFSPVAIGGKFGPHPANQLMGQTVLSNSTPHVQQAALTSGLMSHSYEYILREETENGRGGVCVSLKHPSKIKPPVASQTQWDVLVPLIANEAGIYTIAYTDAFGSMVSSLWYMDAPQSDTSLHIPSTPEQLTDGSLRANDIRVRVLSDDPTLSAGQTAIANGREGQITLKLNRGARFSDAATTSPALWNADILSAGTVTAVKSVNTGLAQDESAVQLTVDLSNIQEDHIIIVPDASITEAYAGCGMAIVAIVAEPDASVDLAALSGAQLQVDSATDLYKIRGDTEWTAAGAKTVPLQSSSDGDGPLDRLQAAVADGVTLQNAITVIAKNDDRNNPVAARSIPISREAAHPPLSIDFEQEKISGISPSAEFAFDTEIPDTFTDTSSTELFLIGQELGTTLYYRTKSKNAKTVFPSSVQSLMIPERPILKNITASTSIPDKERGLTVLQTGGETGLQYAIGAGFFTDWKNEPIPATESDTVTIRQKATALTFRSDEQQLRGQGFAYGTVTGHADHGTGKALLQLKDNGVIFEKAEQLPITVVSFDTATGSATEHLEATATAAAGSTTMQITLKQDGQSFQRNFDSQNSYYAVLPMSLLSEKRNVNQHKTLGASSKNSSGLVEITITENGHHILQGTATPSAGSGTGNPYAVGFSREFIPSGSGKAGYEIIVEGLHSGEQIESVSVSGANITVSDITYDTDSGVASFRYPAIQEDGVTDVRIAIQTKPVVKPLSHLDISWTTGSTTKIYDGTSKGPDSFVPSFGTAALYDDHADVHIQAASIDFIGTDGTKTANAGTGLRIVASGMTVTGTDSAYYQLPAEYAAELISDASILKAKAIDFSIASPISVLAGGVNIGSVLDKIFESEVWIAVENSAVPALPLPLSTFIGSAANMADRNRITGALFTYTASTYHFDQFLEEPSDTVMAILSVSPASGQDAHANTIKNRQAVFAAIDKLDNPENSGQAAVMRSLLQAYLNCLDSGTAFQFELPVDILIHGFPEDNFDFSGLQGGIGGSIALKTQSDLDQEENAGGDLYLVVYTVDPVMGSLTGGSAEKVQNGNVPVAVPAVTATPRYTFEGWLLDEKTVAPGSVTVTEDITFTAGFVKGFLHGDGNGGVRPGDQISRAEFLKMAVYAFGADFAPHTAYDVSMYQDVPESQWYRAIVGYATQRNWISGHEGKFRPNDKITRQEAAKVVYAATNTAPVGMDTTFTDTTSISAWALPYVAALTSNGVLSGYEDSTFRPLRNISRAEAASMLGKAHGFRPDEERRQKICDTVTLSFTDLTTRHWSFPDIAYACGKIDQ